MKEERAHGKITLDWDPATNLIAVSYEGMTPMEVKGVMHSACDIVGDTFRKPKQQSPLMANVPFIPNLRG